MLLSKAIKRAFGDRVKLQNELKNDFKLEGLATIESANKKQLCYIRDDKLTPQIESKLRECKAGALLLKDGLYKAFLASLESENIESKVDSNITDSKDSATKSLKKDSKKNIKATKDSIKNSLNLADSKLTFEPLIVDNPHLAFALLSQLFTKSDFKIYPKSKSKIAKSAQIARNATLGKNVEIGENTHIMPNVVIANDVKIGKNCKIYPNVVIYRESVIGDNVLIHAGSVIGSDGFGYAQDAQGNHAKIEHNGKCVIENDVEIGANNVIDRAVFGETRVKKGSKIGHSCVIAHNSVVGENALLIAQVGLAGSTTTGRNVVLGGQVGTGGHVHIADFVQVAGRGAVSKNLPPNTKWGGHPIMPLDEWMKFYVKLRRLLKENEEKGKS